MEIGAGSGYSAGVLSLIGREVVSLDCFERLAQEARARLDHLKIVNVDLVWGDGFDVSPSYGLFDRILIHGALEAPPPPGLLGALGQAGLLVAIRKREGASAGELFRYSRAANDSIEADGFRPLPGANSPAWPLSPRLTSSRKVRASKNPH